MRRSMRVVILLVLSMVVLFLCFLFTGIRVNPLSTMEGKLLSLLLPEGERGVYYELNGSEGIAVVSEGLKKSRMATVQGLSRNSGTKIVESDFAKEEVKKVKEEVKPKKEFVKEPMKEPAKLKEAEKSLLETVVTKNQKAEKAKLPSERLEELAQRLQKEERRKKKEKKEKERRLAEKKKEEEKKEAEKTKAVVEVKESQSVEEKLKPVTEVKESKSIDIVTYRGAGYKFEAEEKA